MNTEWYNWREEVEVDGVGNWRLAVCVTTELSRVITVRMCGSISIQEKGQH